MSSHGAQRRQLQYIGRLMREVDAEPIRAQLAAIQGGSAEERARQLARGALAHAPARGRRRARPSSRASTRPAELQSLRALIRNARREQAEGRPPRAYRELFRAIREAAGE